MFRKQIDNLKTNHRGVYVLTDHVFAPLKRMSLERGRPADAQMAGAQPVSRFSVYTLTRERGGGGFEGKSRGKLDDGGPAPGRSDPIRSDPG